MKLLSVVGLLFIFGCNAPLAPELGFHFVKKPTAAHQFTAASSCGAVGTPFTVRFSGFGVEDTTILALPITDGADSVSQAINHPLFQGQGTVAYNVQPDCAVFSRSHVSSFVMMPGTPFELTGTLLNSDAWSYSACVPLHRFENLNLVWHGETLEAAPDPIEVGASAVYKWHGAKLYVNEIVTFGPGESSVNGIRMTLPGGREVIVGHAGHFVPCG